MTRPSMSEEAQKLQRVKAVSEALSQQIGAQRVYGSNLVALCALADVQEQAAAIKARMVKIEAQMDALTQATDRVAQTVNRMAVLQTKLADVFLAQVAHSDTPVSPSQQTWSALQELVDHLG